MPLNIESRKFHDIAELIADTSYDDGICVNLSPARVAEFMDENGMLHVDPVTCDCFVSLADLQCVADLFCNDLDVINY